MERGWRSRLYAGSQLSRDRNRRYIAGLANDPLGAPLYPDKTRSGCLSVARHGFIFYWRGIAQIVLITIVWGLGTRIRSPLSFWRWLIPGPARPVLDCLWPWSLAATTVLFLAALEIAIFGYVPGVFSQIKILHICWKLLGVALLFYILSMLSGFVRDIDKSVPKGSNQ